jgi:hypothetical protein
MLTLFLPPPPDLTALLQEALTALMPQSAVYHPDTGKLQLYLKTITADEAEKRSVRGRPAYSTVLPQGTLFDDVIDALTLLSPGIGVHNGCGPSACELCTLTSGHHPYCPLSFRRHLASYLRNLAEFMQGVDKGYMGEVSIDSDDIRSAFGLGVFRGQMQRKSDTAGASSAPTPQGADHS